MMRVTGRRDGVEVVVEDDTGEVIRQVLTVDEFKRLREHLPGDEHDAQQVAFAIRSVLSTTRN